MATEAYRFTIQGISSGEQCQNVLHFLCDNNNDATPLVIAKELVSKWNTSFKAGWKLFNSNHYALRWVSAKRILPSGGNTAVSEYPAGSDPGPINDTQCPLQVSPIVKLFAGLTEGVQGRVFLPTPAESSVVNNVIDTQYHNDVLAHFTAMLSFAGSTHNFNLAVLSRKNATAYAVTTVTMSQIIGMQGRRKRPL